uniref:Uncharacterized protein n=1 Tax=Grammatophora oceanica TaxID=210454 RepID=A0A7S1UZT3_9STRA|mmetsp:Transcript_31597/g.46862  ORF Transcript_31597/g.46862 Transcript_31597/m.46862 type:complete len:322 (+) Transcript_31597:146-1111(+)|eukprot:CAMPEP_0194047834 /NCGR_PEP_ID=MMETSP0009_2-20130614/25751_1 /TAXON_ID=210454 /ORGANISM="Grammatophora oceanica, Strain CCMP 410" /LENGTH=321 /DNA_ID=CAMNT_0038693557 /DNA_START=146 /DNA_END=1111 /DNA_ORIENTATION=-
MIRQLSNFTKSSQSQQGMSPNNATSGPFEDSMASLHADGDGDGRSTLERTVRARDQSVSAMEKRRLEKEQELAALQKELEEERLKQMEEAILHRLEADRLQRQTQAMEERLEALERDMQDKDAIQEYANLIKGVAPKSGVDSQYVMKLQSQLAKAVKKMEATSTQMELVEQSCNEVVTSLKSEITEIVEDRCRTELELRKQLELLEEQKAEMIKDYEEQILKNKQEMDRLKERAAEAQEQESEDVGDGAAKEEDTKDDGEPSLKKELEQAEQKLEELTKTTEDQVQQMKELEEQVQEAEAKKAAAEAAKEPEVTAEAAAEE